MQSTTDGFDKFLGHQFEDHVANQEGLGFEATEKATKTIRSWLRQNKRMAWLQNYQEVVGFETSSSQYLLAEVEYI